MNESLENSSMNPFLEVSILFQRMIHLLAFVHNISVRAGRNIHINFPSFIAFQVNHLRNRKYPTMNFPPLTFSKSHQERLLLLAFLILLQSKLYDAIKHLSWETFLFIFTVDLERCIKHCWSRFAFVDLVQQMITSNAPSSKHSHINDWELWSLWKWW